MSLLASGFFWFGALSDQITHDNVHIVHGLLVFLVVLIFSLLYRASLGTVEEEIIPAGRFSIKNSVQMVVESLLSLFRSMIPHDTEDYFPMLAAVFIFIFSCNLLGIVPGFLPPTESLQSNYAVAITVFFFYNYMGFKKTGFKNYMGHFIGPSLGSQIGMVLFRLLFLAPLMFVIEIVGHSIRPLSLSLRLYGNIFGDHQVLSVFSTMTTGTVMFWVPVAFLAFGIFVAFVQAFVFTLLSTVYVSLAVEHHDDH